MATVIVGIHVAYPKKLIETFDGQRQNREKAGERSCQPYFEPSQPNRVYFIAEWPDLQRASEFWLSDRWKALAKDWSAVGEPSVMVLEDASKH